MRDPVLFRASGQKHRRRNRGRVFSSYGHSIGGLPDRWEQRSQSPVAAVSGIPLFRFSAWYGGRTTALGWECCGLGLASSAFFSWIGFAGALTLFFRKINGPKNSVNPITSIQIRCRCIGISCIFQHTAISKTVLSTMSRVACEWDKPKSSKR